MQQDLNDLYYYVQVVDHCGFASAGRVLGMPKSRLSTVVRNYGDVFSSDPCEVILMFFFEQDQQIRASKCPLERF